MSPSPILLPPSPSGADPSDPAASLQTIGQRFLGADVAADGGDARHDLRVRALGPLLLAAGYVAGHEVRRGDIERRDGDDALVLALSRSGDLRVEHDGRTLDVAAGQAIVLDQGQSYAWRWSGGMLAWIKAPRAALADQVSGLDTALFQPLDARGEALCLLADYLDLAIADTASAPFGAVFASHIVDFMARALQPRPPRDRDAWLALVKRDILANLDRQPLSAEVVAGWYGVTPRTLQRLFVAEPQSVAGFILEQRLLRAHALLTDPVERDAKVGRLAARCGLRNTSNFNQAFRKRFGLTPSALRATVRGATDG